MNDIRSQLGQYFSYVDETQGSVDVFDVVENVVPLPIDSTPQVRSGRGGWLVAAAAAVFVVLLIGGFGLLARVINEPDSSPTADDPAVTTTQPATTSTTVTDALEEAPTVAEEIPSAGGNEAPAETPWSAEDLPATAESGTLDTPLGPASWVRLPTDADTMPRSLWRRAPVAWPSGFAVFVGPQWREEGVLPAELWLSTDGIEWRRQALPLDPSAEQASLTRNGDTYWLASLNPNALWRSADGTTWYEYDSAVLNTSGRGWHTNGPMSPPVTAGDLTLSYAHFNKFVSDANGDPNTIPDPREERLYVIGESEITRIDVPWPTFGNVAQGFNSVTLFASDGWVFAYVVNETYSDSGQTESSDMTVWRTRDGNSWTDLGPPSFLSSSPVAGSARFDVFSEMLVVTISNYSDSGGLPEVTAWESTDGINWVPMPPGRPEGTYPVRLGSGWFANDGSIGGNRDGDAWWIHVGDTWVSLEELGTETPGPTVGGQSGCVMGTTGIDQITFLIGSCGHDGSSLWILSLKPTK